MQGFGQSLYEEARGSGKHRRHRCSKEGGGLPQDCRFCRWARDQPWATRSCGSPRHRAVRPGSTVSAASSLTLSGPLQRQGRVTWCPSGSALGVGCVRDSWRKDPRPSERTEGRVLFRLHHLQPL